MKTIIDWCLDRIFFVIFGVCMTFLGIISPEITMRLIKRFLDGVRY